MGHWIKHFVDGGKYIGDADDVVASWRNSPSEGICCVELREGTDAYLSIEGFGEFWQSDLMTVSFPESCPKVIARSIQKKIERADAFVCVEREGYQLTARVFRSPPTCRTEMFPIQGYMIGKWLTLAYDFGKGVSLSIQDGKL